MFAIKEFVRWSISIKNLVHRFLKAAGGYNDWPNGRGIFFNSNKTFLVWCNEEDHLRLISMQKGGDLAAVYKRLVTVSILRKADNLLICLFLYKCLRH